MKTFTRMTAVMGGEIVGVKELTVEAVTENLGRVLDFLNSRLSELGCSPRAKMQIEVALEEIFVNVASYAYAGDSGEGRQRGEVTIRVEDSKEPLSVEVTISDNGIPFDPLARDDPDVTLTAEERRIGGLGIYMVKKSMDHVRYECRDGRNILTFRKDL